MQLAIYLSVLVAVVAAPLGVLGATMDAPKEIAPRGATQVQQTELDADRVLLRFDVRDSGTAVAVVEYRFALDETNETTAFTRLQSDITANQTQYLSRFERRVTTTVRTAENATGRQMRVTNATVRAETRQLPQPYGVVVYRFTWHGFAAVDDGQLSVGDALAGLYLDDGVQLQISWPDGYHARTVQDGVTEQRDTAAIWVGPTWFDQQGPRVVLAQDGILLDPVPVVLLGVSLLFALSGGAFWWRARQRDDGRSSTPTPPSTEAPSTNPDGGEAPEMTRDVDPEPDPPIGDPELLSNEERVLYEIAKRGGRLKQQELVTTLDWSDAKVSRVVKTLRDRGDVDGFRLGNENVLSIPTTDDEPEEP